MNIIILIIIISMFIFNILMCVKIKNKIISIEYIYEKMKDKFNDILHFIETSEFDVSKILLSEEDIMRAIVDVEKKVDTLVTLKNKEEIEEIKVNNDGKNVKFEMPTQIIDEWLNGSKKEDGI